MAHLSVYVANFTVGVEYSAPMILQSSPQVGDTARAPTAGLHQRHCLTLRTLALHLQCDRSDLRLTEELLGLHMGNIGFVLAAGFESGTELQEFAGEMDLMVMASSDKPMQAVIVAVNGEGK